ncbi:YfhJ family protein [Metabacillus arenae]|uniref:YfhJ family protein n=1 Tax=Metabacillus arenae TaxID=2771434 RepID=A0A926NKT8_9BACI|nr:YfhJ family protein [Metabacillus arenae]MBD1379656.1 YfhJ family protein [Metabacillus arenae]
METYFERLTNLLLEKNDRLSYGQARTWVELLWEDFESNSAKAGDVYKGKNVTERIVTQLIQQYGDKLDEFVATNPKYKHLLDNDHLKH